MSTHRTNLSVRRWACVALVSCLVLFGKGIVSRNLARVRLARIVIPLWPWEWKELLVDAQSSPLGAESTASLRALDAAVSHDTLRCRDAGVSAMLQGDFIQAGALFAECSQQDTDVVWWAGLAHYLAGEQDEALRLWSHPVYYSYLLGLGTYDANLRNVERAEPLLGLAARLKPQDADPYLILGNAFFDLGRVDRADHNWTLALARPGGNPGWRTMALGYQRVVRRDWLAASAAFSDAIRQEPRHYLAFYWYGRSQRELGFNAEAIQALTRAATLEPGHCDTHYQLALALAADGQSARALAQALWASKLSPANAAYKELLDRLREGV